MTPVLQIIALLRDASVIVLAAFVITLYKQVIMVKDAEIGQLKSRIEDLEATSAPVLLDQNEKMSAALNRYAGKAAGLEEALKQALAQTDALAKITPPAIESAEIAGSFGAAFESLIIISEAIAKTRALNILAGRESGQVLDQFNAAADEIHALVQTLFEGKKPSFPHLKKRIQEHEDAKARGKT
jgi:hypothetical protein